MDKPSEHNRTPDRAAGPGKILRQARTDLGLSPEDVALQLHLAARQIVALENDDYKNLPQPTYVRGYLRNYALLLGLSPEPLLAAYTATLTQAVPAPAPTAAAKPAARMDEQIKFVLYGLAGVVVMALLWWFGHTTSTSENPPPVESVIETPSAVEATPTAPPAVEPKAAEKPPEKKNTPPIPAPRPAPTTAPPTVAPPPGPVTSAPANQARARLIVRAEQDSWADIRDVHDTRLLYETVPAGRIVTLEGVPPFSVFLGNVDGIKLEFNGRPYDASRHKRGLVARFTLGAQTAPASVQPAPTQPAPLQPGPTTPAPNTTAPNTAPPGQATPTPAPP